MLQCKNLLKKGVKTMTNWCEGNLRIRGTIKQIREFMRLAVDVDDIKRYIESDIALDI